MSGVTYLLCRFAPRKQIQTCVFLWNLGYIVTCHVHRMWIDYLGWTLDVTGPLMVMCFKLISVGVNVHDGMNAESRMSDRQKAHALASRPSILEFMGYCLFFPAFLTGPWIEFSDYQQFIRRSHADMDRHTKDPFARSLLGASCFAVLTQIGAWFFPVANLRDDAWLLEHGVLFKIAYVYAMMFLLRCKYYFGWKVAEAGCLASGFGFSGMDGDRPVFALACNVSARRVECTSNAQDLTRYWNATTGRFLRYYVYERLRVFRSLGAVPATYVTFLTSAVWHGLYPGYAIFFSQFMFFATFLGNLGNERLLPYFDDQNRLVIYRVVATASFMVLKEYIGVPFMLLSFADSIRFYMSVFFVGHILSLAFYVVVSLLPARRATPQQKEKST